jgi:hypothetical protein
MSPPGWNHMTPSATVKSRAETTRRQLIVLSSQERMELHRRRRQRQALHDLCLSTVYALLFLTLLALSLIWYAAARLR